ncbi:MAG: hypothetical protein J3Q66DRAFT_443327 [Benniella sp.]|nr:MAG: hypothetical protein J3Q66DRAFT_443327 [Benniella sp.]
MLDLPELLEKVFQHLDRHDLTQCAQVNKQWHALTIPYIWRSLMCVCSGDERKKAFRRMVLEDYLQENGYQERPQKPSVLSNYGHLIRLLPNHANLENALRTQACTQQGNEPTVQDLILHLFKYSSKAQVMSLHYKFKDMESDKMKSILAFTLPRLRSLDIQAPLRATRSEFIKFKGVLDQCSTTLENLDVSFFILGAYEAVNVEDEVTEDESICWTSLKNLALQHDHDTLDAGPLLAWMWKRCGQLKRLYVRRIDKSTPSFVQAMLDYMHNLEEITIGDDTYPDWAWNPEDNMEDDVVAALLSGSRHGWKSVSVMSTAEFGPGTMSALEMHYSTLGKLSIDGSNGLQTCDVVQVLRSCPHLHTLYYNDFCKGSCSAVNGAAFIDLDPDTGLLKPWLCEGSLKVLDVKIDGIQRPDLEICSLVEAYPGQGREIQSQLYDRLGRLNHLETLKLGDRCGRTQYDCLEMSLESGLDKLSGLKSLKELNIEKMVTMIGTKEVQWMVENWPKLSAIYGLDGRGWDMEAVEWLRENCPKIVVQKKR